MTTRPAEDTSDFRDQMEALNREFAELLRERLEEIESLWRALAGGEWTREKIKALNDQVHILSGSSASFGYSELGRAAIALERHLNPWSHLEQAPGERALQEVSPLISALRRSADPRSWDG